ncbi:sensor histidine kinase [Nonomuraea sp. NPDC050451]|uniref:sensor histidine kinase n=1 Tax=Nonomuraea sp. NPDC050451 TaxID=3364364 RepID=UPI0037A2726E
MESALLQFVYHFQHKIRAVGVIPCAALAVPAMPPGGKMLPVAIIAGLAIIWSVVYYKLGVTRSRPRLLFAVDLIVMTGLCLTQFLTVPDRQTMHGSTWILASVSIVVVTYQMAYPWMVALPSSLLLAAADLGGAILDRAHGWTYALPNVGWLLVQTVLCQWLFQLLLRRCRSADVAALKNAAARRQHLAVEAQRLAEREYLATLHDTACATLMMVASRGNQIHPDNYRAMARSDLERLTLEGVPTGELDLETELMAEIDKHPLRVVTRFHDTLGHIWGPAALALRNSLGEALRNVISHAGVHSARVTASVKEEVVTVTITDEGVGFDVAHIPPHSFGLAKSIVGRMAAVGGRATITSQVGCGAEVWLEWPGV